MDQRQPPRLARPYVLDATAEHTAQVDTATWPVVRRTGSDRTGPGDARPAADAPTVPVDPGSTHNGPTHTGPTHTGPTHTGPTGTGPAGTGTPVARRRPASHHLWARRHQARWAGAATPDGADRPFAALFGAHGTTATFVVIVVGVAAAVLAVAAMKGRTPPQPAATSRGGVSSPEPGADASAEQDGPPAPTGTPLVPPAPGVVLPDGAAPPGAAVPPVGNAAGAPAGKAPAGGPGAPAPGPAAPAPGPAAPPGARPTATPTGARPTVPEQPTTTPPAPKEPEKGTAYRTIQGESFDGQSGVKIEAAESGGGRHAGFISTGDWIRYDGVTFTGDTARTLRVRASNGARQNRTGDVELRLDRRSNAPIGRMTIPNNGLDRWFDFSTYSMSISPTTGTHTIYLTFTSGQNEEFANVDWLTFTP